MKRMIDVARIARLLQPAGFALASDMNCSDILYSRPSPSPELWEQIIVNVGGKRGNAVGTRVQVNVCYGALFAPGLAEDRYVPETGTPLRPPPDERGGTVFLKDTEDAVVWERLVAEVCPAKARALADEAGSKFLTRTATARHAVGKYLGLFGTHNWRKLRERLEPRATSSELRRAEQIATTPPTIQVYNGREFYTTIVLGIILYSDEAEGRQVAPAGVEVWPPFDPFSRTEPDWSKWALAWRIEILADRMLCRYPEPMPSRIPDEDTVR